MLASGNSYLVADLSIECDVGYKSSVFPVALLALLAYGGGVPLLLFLRIRMHREVLNAAAAEFTLGFLYKDYKDEFCYWECGELLRKLVLCGILRHIEPESASQFVAGICFCVFTLALVAYFNPSVAVCRPGAVWSRCTTKCLTLSVLVSEVTIQPLGGWQVQDGWRQLHQHGVPSLDHACAVASSDPAQSHGPD